MLVRRLRVLKLEAIVRGYITGSAWNEYSSRSTVHGIPMPPGLQLCQKFDKPLFTPSTKADAGAHDENIHPDDAWKELGGDEQTARDLARRVQDLALSIYSAAAEYAEKRGIIIADTKFEFAIDDADGSLYLVDEVLTPDSSRFWPLESYKVGREQESFDKQIIRNWLTREGLKGKQGVTIPDDICKATEERYKDVFLKLTGSSFDQVAAKSS
ncbi:hypothetical protein CDD82_5984 [Ophiocordyceps australis]|uniref:Phosphoribosylaminoimidazole-succinocarboxamide synthase n=1 Tax=Ophiocordyceps australis TaxID=1399860 RepID=A0A2C5Y2U2_9HYPO|nr:hypothetical protein CDD82_5984 [Ophiocordyceps australis]